MSTLVAVAYDTKHEAEEVRLKLLKLNKEYLIALEDAVVAYKDEKGKIKLLQLTNLTAMGAANGGFWGLLIGLLFLNPLFGAAIGAAAGAVGGTLTDLGINDKFMKDIAEELTPGHSILFVLFRGATADRALEELAGTGGKIIKTSLSHEDEAILQKALDEATAKSQM